MNGMKAGLRMKFVSFVCVLLGVVLLVTGAGLRLLVENLDEVKVANETAEEHIGMRISPRAARLLLQGKLAVDGELVSMDDILPDDPDAIDHAALLIFRLYAHANLMIGAGAALLAAAWLARRPRKAE